MKSILLLVFISVAAACEPWYNLQIKKCACEINETFTDAPMPVKIKSEKLAIYGPPTGIFMVSKAPDCYVTDIAYNITWWRPFLIKEFS